MQRTAWRRLSHQTSSLKPMSVRSIQVFGLEASWLRPLRGPPSNEDSLAPPRLGFTRRFEAKLRYEVTTVGEPHRIQVIRSARSRASSAAYPRRRAARHPPAANADETHCSRIEA